MKYLHSFFKARKGYHAKVNFERTTVVKLLSDREFKKYKNGQTHRYRGGTLEAPVTEFVIPTDGRWHVVVELGGYFNAMPMQASVELIKDPSGPAKRAKNVAPPPAAVAEPAPVEATPEEAVAEEIAPEEAPADATYDEEVPALDDQNAPLEEGAEGEDAEEKF